MPLLKQSSGPSHNFEPSHTPAMPPKIVRPKPNPAPWSSPCSRAAAGMRGKGGLGIGPGGGGPHCPSTPPLHSLQLLPNPDTHPGQQGGPTEISGRPRYDRSQAYSLLLKTHQKLPMTFLSLPAQFMWIWFQRPIKYAIVNFPQKTAIKTSHSSNRLFT